MMVSPFDIPYCPDGCPCRRDPPPYDWILGFVIVFLGAFLLAVTG